MFGAAKVPHYNRNAIAQMLGLPSSKVHLHEGHVGGGFGVRGELYPEDVLVALGRSVWGAPSVGLRIAASTSLRPTTRAIRFTGCGSGQLCRRDTGNRRRVLAGPGCLPAHPHAATVADRRPPCFPVPTGCPHIGAEDTSSSPIRPRPERTEGPVGTKGALPESGSSTQSLIGWQLTRWSCDDAISSRRAPCHMNEVCWRWAPRWSTTRATIRACWSALSCACRSRPGCREPTSPRELAGCGLALFVEKSGLGPFDGVRVTVDETGAVEVVTGAASMGQGSDRCRPGVAQELGVALESVNVVHGQTDRIDEGMGASPAG